MIFTLFLSMVLAEDIESVYEFDKGLAIRLFGKEDTDNDGKLTTSQFVNGMTSAFISMGVEKNQATINNFAREFAGKKHTKGVVLVSDIKIWVESEEIINTFADWLHIFEEGDAHSSPHHNHMKEKMNDHKTRQAALRHVLKRDKKVDNFEGF